MGKMIKLREHQKKAKLDLRSSYLAGNRAPLVVMPTGAGKTIFACDISIDIINKGKRAYFVTHRDSIHQQTLESFGRFEVDADSIARGRIQVDSNIQVAMIGTLLNRLEFTPPPDLLVIDECHHAPASQWVKLRQNNIPCDKDSMSFKMEEPVVEKPDIVSKKASV